MGCYADDAKRDFDFGPGAWGGYMPGARYTIANCDTACKGFKYLALQAGGASCFCSNTYSSNNQYAQKDAQECGSPCEGETSDVSTQYCGGEFLNAIYTTSGGDIEGKSNIDSIGSIGTLASMGLVQFIAFAALVAGLALVALRFARPARSVSLTDEEGGIVLTEVQE